MSTDADKENEEVVESPEIDFKPLVNLPLMKLNTLEDNEEEILKLRAKLFRFESANEPPEWKERGIGDIKLMKNKATQNVRLIMRRDKTHKICANHLLTKEMSLIPCAGSDKAWVYTVLADFADEEPKKEQLAIRFKNAEIARQFKDVFETAQENIPSSANTTMTNDDPTTNLTSDLEKLDVGTKDDGNGTQAGDNKSTDEPKDESQVEDDDKKKTEAVEPVATNDGGNTS
ncbi:PREDICTED: ran-specific GTPase-activating protein-like [Amphimedon queenslandica]|uniref:Ran-specific GTPase-activating protein n=1 Tax=Amphimedon queenslandica TaxID=400682 RepID=A0A1X7V984_AMPQE|nr:PREDICTED: ran-specific GTPase-activating protein-like [Amphimedon queenslandica]|eukprot:XP_003385196.1 PREDICTED: ran-specific GTPase-activating protein-like [Amphimedon queenslandica]